MNSCGQSMPTREARSPAPLSALLRACGGKEGCLPMATAVELIHSFSLVHDDIQDNSPLRRHRPTVWALWGIAHAINVGDVLYAAAHQALLRLRGTAPAEVILSLAEEFESTCVRICEGQYLDMGFETQDDVEWDDYVAMIERKTGVLMSYAAWSGATVAGAEQERAERLRAFGMRWAWRSRSRTMSWVSGGRKRRRASPAPPTLPRRRRRCPSCMPSGRCQRHRLASWPRSTGPRNGTIGRWTEPGS